jgi:ABC-type transporter Mla MlaB component
MDLQITNYNNRFQIKGTFNKLTIQTFNSQFANIFDKLDEILLDIESIESIDRAGVMALARLHNESIIKSKRLSIIGLGCKELYQHFKIAEPNTANISVNGIVAA